ncbi:DUF3885 domain-containing protein [Pontibacillus litoralis]|uniref:DUF3885 domain-containing protein n=1 Tax=Pontibacillus litoralis JSM 072002 TaxID=1385512 RepID=A0A0A5FXP0_9BACI|nr:DUF3885 domain-containing protein [Pontibacillus litoralis]KGX84554.1 hypothetical protein N784_13265 [Pontibacillus litoralis JSM 072002]
MELFNQLIRNQKYWIRFELGLIELEGKEYFKEIYHRVLSIFDFLFDENDTIMLIASINESIGYRGNDDLPNIQRFLKDKKLIYGLKCKTVPYEYDKEDTEMRTTFYSLMVKKEDIRRGYLFQAISNKDFGRKPSIMGNLYLLNLTRNTLLHMYDDRGCDVYGLNKENLLPLYHKFRKWILDYNRIQIDHMFEEGLYNYSESSTEMENRLKTNRIRVKETEINLYEDNTCVITHQLEIPTKDVEECMQEIEQIGFTIEIDNNYNDYIILKVIKTEALALIDYQTELMFLYSKKYNGKYGGWSVKRVS